MDAAWTMDEARDEVGKFLDKAFLAGLPRVANVTEPGQNEGGAGATVVELR